jgi:hypothetical protein
MYPRQLLRNTTRRRPARAQEILIEDMAPHREAKEVRASPDVLRILEDACREADLIDWLRGRVARPAVHVTGSQGEDLINPLIPEPAAASPRY